ncbi:hypothetical protein BKA70DRAFT_1316492 [Coprinopsis sp. MPI-PUGE-AT-0042]|nr:hypothetical protein BKA70DRAFT_1316492 [Coprinopsis sp. MPI-PUGE-AT-0042]
MTQSSYPNETAIMGLPLEIFCEILLWVSTSLGDAALHERVMEYQTLCLVCRDWKVAVEGEKRLWTSCSIDYDLSGFPDTLTSSMEDMARAEIEAPERYYLHAGQLRLDLKVTIYSYDESMHGDLKPLINFIVSWGQHWERLSLNADDVDSLEMSRWIPDLLLYAHTLMTSTGRSPFTSMEHLVLRSNSLVEAEPRTGSYLLPLADLFTGLKNLNIRLPCLFQSHDLPAQLRLPAPETLKLQIELYEDFQHLSLRDVLVNATNLKSLKLVNPHPQPSLSPTTHIYLQVLILRNSRRNALKELGTLSLPALTVLVVHASCSPAQPDYTPGKIEELLTTSITRMGERSQCQLEVLRLSCPGPGFGR